MIFFDRPTARGCVALGLSIVVAVALAVVPVEPALAIGSDTDGDGVTDDVDIDDDGDGILDLIETTEAFTWAAWNPISGNTATGTIGAINFTYTSSTTILTTTSMFNHASFPAQYNVPNSNPTIRNDIASSNTITFSAPALNPTVALSSIGNNANSVSVVFDRPVEVLWSQTFGGGTFTVDSASQITGAEAYAVVKVPGEHSSISFDYLEDEAYVNFAFGADPRATTDSDSDGAVDHHDLDVDNDGITDNVEAQTTAGYVAPSGDDADGNGLDDAYESAPGAGEGLTPVNTDGTDDEDYRDDDSDNDGTFDVAERGDGQATSVGVTTDTDGDGLYDIFESGTPNDGFDVNDDNRDATVINLAADHLLASDGSNAVPVSIDVFFRDAVTGTDTDADGIADGIEFVTSVAAPVDTDGSGGVDYIDTDADGDTIGDATEYGRDVSAVDFGADADNDGVPDDIDADSTGGADTNTDGVLDAFEPIDTDGDTTPDYRDDDSDGDTIADSIEGAGDTDTDTTPDYLDRDSDNDGNDDDTDPNRVVATAQDDTVNVAAGSPVTVDVLANDDFLPGPNLTLTVTGGTAAGSSSTDSSSGQIDYTAGLAEAGPVTLTYDACHTSVTPTVCDSATLTVAVITAVTDSDADGTPDLEEMGSDPNSPTDSDSDGTPDHLDDDSDNDGRPDGTDPNRATPSAQGDAGAVDAGQSVTIDLLANDDIVPGAAVTMTRTGGTATGTVTFDPLTGTVSYAAAATEAGTVTIEYQACHTAVSPPGCGSATITLAITAVAVDPPRHCDYDLNAYDDDPDRRAVAQLYLMLFRRLPEAEGLDYWTGLVHQGFAPDQIRTWMLAGTEFPGRYGALDDVAFTTTLYDNLLCREPDSTGATYWHQALESQSHNRTSMVLWFFSSPEFQAKKSRLN